MFSSLLYHLSRLDAHQRLLIALFIAGATFFILPPSLGNSIRIIIVWITYATVTLASSWLTILMVHPRDLPKYSRIEDSSRILIMAFVVIAAMASLLADVSLLGSMNEDNRLEHVSLGILAVSSAWALLHTMFTLRYAHLYYGNDQHEHKHPGGLDFPHEDEPDYLDFAYFSFVIGMTSQVSDVAIGSRTIRRTALVHGVLSFGFNAIIIALTISSLSGMLN